MQYEKAWVKSISKDFKILSEEEFEEVDKEFESILNSPNTHSKRVKGWNQNIRRVKTKIKNKPFRLLIYVKDSNLTAYGLAFLPRKSAYSKQTQKAIAALIKEIDKTSS